MAYIRGAFTNLFGKSVVDDFKKLYLLKDGEPINYKDPPLITKRLIPKKFALGFRITRQMIEDDLYGGIVTKKGKKKLVLKISYSVDVGFQEITRTGDVFNIPSMGLTIEDTKQLVKALNLLLKVKTPTKKVVRRKRRVKK